jgi:hypothetical protein
VIPPVLPPEPPVDNGTGTNTTVPTEPPVDNGTVVIPPVDNGTGGNVTEPPVDNGTVTPPVNSTGEENDAVGQFINGIVSFFPQ